MNVARATAPCARKAAAVKLVCRARMRKPHAPHEPLDMNYSFALHRFVLHVHASGTAGLDIYRLFETVWVQQGVQLDPRRCCHPNLSAAPQSPHLDYLPQGPTESTG